ncbi:MAG: hypothetical protein JWN66_4541 [Sphingomonas bacterium]|jgi:uncharacterized membrane protein|uniref:TMEM175 family protein n=1 Tax=Sphingomonas bacterium TaxID=1895847 RepID=UPI002603DE01|nr:TMEM175 family protein [Sphingomonas bacterium]MDB5707425.1 hypothetical protein [Sphingomonas bacterium]
MVARQSGGPEHALERLVFFSDAVFAIAITLLIIEIHIPRLPIGSSDAEYINALANLWPNFFGFFVSFWVIAAFWAGHHRAFCLAAHYSDRLVMPNLALLCVIVFMPFATGFMGGNIGTIVPTALYDATLVFCGLLNVRLVRIVTSPPIVNEAASEETIAMTRVRGWAVVLGGGSALAFAFVDPRFSQFALISIPFWRRLLQARLKHRFVTA